MIVCCKAGMHGSFQYLSLLLTSMCGCGCSQDRLTAREARALRWLHSRGQGVGLLPEESQVTQGQIDMRCYTLKYFCL